MKVLALDFGGSSVKYGIVDENAVISESGKRPAPLSSVEEFLDTVESLYEQYKDAVEGIGMWTRKVVYCLKTASIKSCTERVLRIW